MNAKTDEPLDAEVVQHSTEIKESTAAAPSTMESTHDKLIELALGKGDVESLEKMMALKERHEANEARKAYNAAMAKFRELCPAIKKTKTVDFTSSKGRTHYNHADLSGALEQIKPHMASCGLSHSWKTNQTKEGTIEVTCIVTHKLGHSESTPLFAPADNTGNKTLYSKLGQRLHICSVIHYFQSLAWQLRMMMMEKQLNNLQLNTSARNSYWNWMASLMKTESIRMHS